MDRNVIFASPASPSPGHRRSKSDGVPINLGGVGGVGVVATPANRPFVPTVASSPADMVASGGAFTAMAAASKVTPSSTASASAADDIFSPDCRGGDLSGFDDSGLTSAASASKTPSPPKRIPPAEGDCGGVDGGGDGSITGSLAGSEGNQSVFYLRSHRTSQHSRSSTAAASDDDDLRSRAETPSKRPSQASFAPPKSKKSWYSALTPTYKTRSEEFLRLFKKVSGAGDGCVKTPSERGIVHKASFLRSFFVLCA